MDYIFLCIIMWGIKILFCSTVKVKNKKNEGVSFEENFLVIKY